MKTVSAALVMCLNIGVDPPDIVKTSQCSKLECWISKSFFLKKFLISLRNTSIQTVIIYNEAEQKLLFYFEFY
jgi:hypothetical protein